MGGGGGPRLPDRVEQVRLERVERVLEMDGDGLRGGRLRSGRLHAERAAERGDDAPGRELGVDVGARVRPTIAGDELGQPGLVLLAVLEVAARQRRLAVKEAHTG